MLALLDLVVTSVSETEDVFYYNPFILKIIYFSLVQTTVSAE